ncbi:hypothetical protein BN135_3321 [Cronobacter muytjensii 530]
MTAADLAQVVIVAAAAHRHRKFALLPGNLVIAGADDRPGGEHVVERRQVIAVAGQMGDAEVFGVAISGREDPEDNLGAKKVGAVGLRMFRAAQDSHDIADARPAIGLIFTQRRDAERLAHVLLREAQPPLFITRQPPVETLNDQRFLLFELRHLRARDRNAVRVQQHRAEPFVFNGGAHIRLHVAHQPQGELENMRGGRIALRQAPLPVVPQQRGFLLRAGDGEPQFLVATVLTGKRRSGVAQHRGDIHCRERPRANGIQPFRRFTVAQQLDCPDAVAPELRQQIERFQALRPVARRQTPPDAFAVRQQVIEVIAYPRAAHIRAGRERQRQRERPALRVMDPVRKVVQPVLAVMFIPVTDRDTVHPERQARRAAHRHHASRRAGESSRAAASRSDVACVSLSAISIPSTLNTRNRRSMLAVAGLASRRA